MKVMDERNTGIETLVISLPDDTERREKLSRQFPKHWSNVRIIDGVDLRNPDAAVAIAEPWISYLGELPQASVPELIRACNVVTVPYADDVFNSMTGPCKIAEYLACGKPVVATRVSGHERIFRDALESLCEPDSDDMARALRCQLTNPVVAPFPESLDWACIGEELHESLATMQAESTVPG